MARPGNPPGPRRVAGRLRYGLLASGSKSSLRQPATRDLPYRDPNGYRPNHPDITVKPDAPDLPLVRRVTTVL